MRRAALLSVGLHTVLVLLLVAGAWLWPARGIKGPPVLAEVQLIEQNTPEVGRREASPATPPPVPPVVPAKTQAAPASPSPAPPLSPSPRAVLPMPPPAPPAPPPTPPAPAPALQSAAAAVRLGEPGAAGTGLVSGSQVIPAALDKAVQNVPPAYPPRAVRRGQQGTVILKVHVAADGVAAAVDVVTSSGYDLLDRAAQRAVARWHFVPASRAGLPVPSAMLVRIRFVLTNPKGSQ